MDGAPAGSRLNPLGAGEAALNVAEQSTVFPDGFDSTTNLEARVHLDGVWYDTS